MTHGRNTIRPFVKERVETPRLAKDKDGSALLFCPFCKPTHSLRPDAVSMCGTILQVRAVQRVYNAKYKKDMVCVKCGKGGGEMVQYQNAFQHIGKCAEGVMTMVDPPRFSLIAKQVNKLPEWIRSPIEKFTGRAMPVDEVMPDGTRTGTTLGYFFYKESAAKKQEAA